MSTSAFLVHAVLGVLALGPAAAAGILASRRWVTKLSGPSRWLADAVAAIGALLLVSEIVGAFGWFTLAGIATIGGACCAVMVAIVVLRPRTTDLALPSSPAPTGARWAMRPLPLAVVAVALAGTLIQWVSVTGASLRLGESEVDSLNYHLPFAARFVQGGWLTRFAYVSPDPFQAFYPDNSEVVHALGMLVFGSHVVTPLINLGWLFLLLLAGWCLGHRYGLGPVALLAAVIVFAVPAIAGSAPGTAMSDAPSIALLMAAVALLVCADGELSCAALAGLAGGMAVGTKFTVLVPVVLLTVAAAVVARDRERWRSVGIFVAGAVVGGGYWFIRNLVRTGSPVPSLGLGPLPKAPTPLLDLLGYRLSGYLGDWHLWRTMFLPGLFHALGPAAPLILAGCVAGGVLAFVRGTRRERAIALAGAVAVLAYPFTPLSAAGPKGNPNPVYFDAGVRYLIPGLLLLAAAGVLTLSRRSERGQQVAFGALVVTYAVSLVPQHYVSSVTRFPTRYSHDLPYAVVAVVLAYAVFAGLLWLRRRGSGLPVAGAVVALALALCVGYAPIGRRFVAQPVASPATGAGAVYRVAGQLHAQRIGLAAFYLGFPLTGVDLTNQVDLVHGRGPNGGLTLATSCRQWRQQVNAGRFDYLVIGATGVLGGSSPVAWTRSDPAAVPVLHVGDVWMFALRGQMSPDGCAEPASAAPAA